MLRRWLRSKVQTFGTLLLIHSIPIFCHSHHASLISTREPDCRDMSFGSDNDLEDAKGHCAQCAVLRCSSIALLLGLIIWSAPLDGPNLCAILTLGLRVDELRSKSTM
jgi:hypothetical protein